MPSLQVREMPTLMYETLREVAKREHRSLAQQALVTLEKGLEMTEDNRARRRALFQRIKENPVCPSGANLPDAVELIRQDRDR